MKYVIVILKNEYMNNMCNTRSFSYSKQNREIKQYLDGRLPSPRFLFIHHMYISHAIHDRSEHKRLRLELIHARRQRLDARFLIGGRRGTENVLPITVNRSASY
jgi:hypothetical protein